MYKYALDPTQFEKKTENFSTKKNKNQQKIKMRLSIVLLPLTILSAIITVASASCYVVKNGDTLSKIAAQHHIPLDKLIKANPRIKNPNVIFVGECIKIP